MLDPVRHQQMAEWGFNAVRLGSMWSGVEPAEGVVRGWVGVYMSDDNGNSGSGERNLHRSSAGDSGWGIRQWYLFILGHASGNNTTNNPSTKPNIIKYQHFGALGAVFSV